MAEELRGAAAKRLPERVDVALIGSGLGSLACAIELARQGLGVLVLEQHRLAGGYAHGFRRKGYHFDVSLHHLGGMAPGGMTHGVLYSLGVLDGISLDRRRMLFAADYPGLALVLPNDCDGIFTELKARFPAEGDGIDRLLALLVELKREVTGPTVDPEATAAGPPPRLIAVVADRTFGELIDEHVSDPRLRAILGQLWMYIGLPPSLSTATFSACVFCSTFVEGAFHVVGGGTALVRAMVDRLRELGGECATQCEVAAIEVEDGRATGVRLTNGTRVAAGTVIAGIDPWRVFGELLPQGAVSRVFHHRLDAMEPSVSLYSLYLGLDCPPSALGVPQGNYFNNHGFDIDASWRRALAGDVARTDWCMTSYECESEASMYPSGGGIVSMVEVTPPSDWHLLDEQTYRERKAEVERLMLAKAEARFPGIAAHAAVRELATPRTMTRYTGNRLGAVYGLAQTVGQSNSHRLRNRTPVHGLFLTGAWTWSGGGYEGAMMSGLQTANAVIEELGHARLAPLVRLHADAPSPALAPSPPGTRREPETRRYSAPDDARYRFHLPVTVYGEDLNSRGCVDASAFLRFMDRGRCEAIEEICLARGQESWLTEYMVNVYRIDIRCATVTRLSDRQEVRTGIRRTSSHRAAFDQRIINATTGEIVVDGVVEVAFLDSERRLREVPAELVPGDAEDTGPRPRMVPLGDDDRLPYRNHFRVYYEDTDAQGITYHVSYVRFCERALFDLSRTLWPEMPTEAWMRRFRPGVASVEVRYLNPSHLGDRVEVRTGVIEVSSHRVTFRQRIVEQATGRLLTDAVTDVEFRDDEERLVPVPRPVVDI
ncbi:MAG TPA: FAD-dependent oxidoreductase, partial [Polyangia bacterium]|nr:FAD-dependent oxidoreductase [Polyangia bacterium]